MVRSAERSRREFLRLGVAGVAAMAPFRSVTQVIQDTETTEDTPLPFQLGLQSYTLRKFSRDEVIEKAGNLAIHHLEFFPGHLPMDIGPDEGAQLMVRLGVFRITLPSYGVVTFGAEEAENRPPFEFARKFGIKVLAANPAPESFPHLDELVEEFDIKVAIHNHGPGSRYSSIDDVVNAIADHDPRIGACVDTGHFLRSKEDPAEALRRLGNRVHAVHLKDIRSYEDHTNVVNGRGVLDLEGTLGAVKEIGFSGHMAIEYEAEPENPVPAVEECLAEVRKVASGW